MGQVAGEKEPQPVPRAFILAVKSEPGTIGLWPPLG